MKITNHGAAYDAVFPILMSAVYSVHLIRTPVILHIYVKKFCFCSSAVTTFYDLKCVWWRKVTARSKMM
jgi:hypothetical protein